MLKSFEEVAANLPEEIRKGKLIKGVVNSKCETFPEGETAVFFCKLETF